jgi:hypothetical protein
MDHSLRFGMQLQRLQRQSVFIEKALRAILRFGCFVKYLRVQSYCPVMWKSVGSVFPSYRNSSSSGSHLPFPVGWGFSRLLKPFFGNGLLATTFYRAQTIVSPSKHRHWRIPYSQVTRGVASLAWSEELRESNSLSNGSEQLLFAP